MVGVAGGDFNGDNKQDLSAIYFDYFTQSGGAIFVAGNGDGSFASPKPVSLLGNAPIILAAADLNGDKKMDLVVADQNGTVIAYLGNGDGTFRPASQILQIAAAGLALADVTGDGIPDLLSVSLNTLTVYAGGGDGTFAAAPVLSVTLPSQGAPLIQVGDVNGDGRPDIAVAGFDLSDTGQVLVFLNRGNGNFVQDTHLYFTGGRDANGFALTRVNNSAVVTGGKQALDALVSVQAGVVSLLNQSNPAPLTVPALTLSTANQSMVSAGQTVTVNALLFVPGKLCRRGLSVSS